MLLNLKIEPSILSLLTTFFCTAKCKNCCFQCGPDKNEKMTLVEMKNYIDEVIKSYPTIKVAVFSGGECFSLKDDLVKIIKYASEQGLSTRVVTNGYWATSYKKASTILGIAN